MENENTQCQYHPFMKPEVYCESCNCCICSICRDEDIHKNHVCLHLYNVGKNLRQQIEDIIVSINTKLHTNSPSESHLSSQQLTLIQQQIQFYKKLKQQFLKIIDDKIEALNQLIKPNPNSHISQIQTLSKSLSTLSEKIEQNIRNKHFYSIFCDKKQKEKLEHKLSHSIQKYELIQKGSLFIQEKLHSMKDAQKVQLAKLKEFSLSLEKDCWFEQNSGNQSPYIHYLNRRTDLNSFEIFLYDVSKRQSFTHCLQFNTKILDYWSSCNLGNSVFFTEGMSTLAHYSSVTYEFNIPNRNLQNRANMLHLKRSNRLLGVHPNLVFSMGGKAPEDWISICEKFEVDKNWWTLLPSLNEKKVAPSANLFNENIIYLTGGYNGQSFLKTIEKFEINHENKGWKKIHLKECSHDWNPKSQSASLQISSNSIIIFGGFNGNDQNSSFVFNVETLSLEKSQVNMTIGDTFFKRPPAQLFGGKIYIIGEKSCDLHMFDIVKGQWDLIKFSEWSKN